jgi:hypothetical protein
MVRNVWLEIGTHFRRKCLAVGKTQQTPSNVERTNEFVVYGIAKQNQCSNFVVSCG